MGHSYLLLSVAIAAAGIISSLAVPQYRWFIATSGLLATPAGLADWIFVPEYWRPDHVIGPWFSVEGMLFSFGNGCLIMLPVALRWAEKMPPHPAGFIAPLGRLTTAMAFGIGVFLLTWQSALGWLMIMHATYVGLAAIAAFLSLKHRFSLAIALTSGFGFSLVYGAETMVWHWIDPAFNGFWAADGTYLFSLPFPPGLPIEEYIWAFTYAAVWANLMLYGFIARQQTGWQRAKSGKAAAYLAGGDHQSQSL